MNADENDIQWEDLARYTDAFYIGGTKNGALIGEAIVFNNPFIGNGFSYYVKQKGALLAKGRVLGLQFLTLFQNDLYNQLGRQANQQMKRIKTAFEAKGVSFLSETCTNQLFPILKNEEIAKLAELFDFYEWKKIDKQHTAIRLITSWATPNENVEALISALGRL